VVELQVRNGAGNVIATKQYTLLAYEQILVGLRDVIGTQTVSGGMTRALVKSGGRVIMHGSMVANGNGNSTGFEMSFRPALIETGGDDIDVESLNGLTGHLDLIGGNGVTITENGNSIFINVDGIEGP